MLPSVKMFKRLCQTPSFCEERWRRQVAAQDPASLYAPHYDQRNRRFYNPWLRRQQHHWVDYLHFLLSRGSYPAYIPPHDTSGLCWRYNQQDPDQLVMLGHSSLAVQAAGQLLLLDPFCAKRAFHIKRSLPSALDIASLPHELTIVISHNHYDHLDKSTIRQLARARFICPLGVGNLLRAWGATRVQELDWWQDIIYDNLKLTCLPAHHWSRRLTQPTNRSLWASWLLEINGGRLYFGGDSAYFVGYKEIGRRYPGIDLALLSCGAFAPRWFMHQSHTDVPEMFLAFDELGAKHLVPIHWGSMALGHEPACEPLRLIHDHLARHPLFKSRVRIINVAEKLLLWP